jgi:hypothetical protein
VIAGVLAGGHVADQDLVPVAAAAGDRVAEQLAVVARGEIRQSHGAVGRQRVRVEQQPALAVQRVGHLEHRLVLQAGVVGEEPFPAELLRRAGALEVPQTGEAVADLRPLRDGLQERLRDLVLGRHPRLGVGGIVVLQPAVGIGNRGAVELLHHLHLAGRRIVHRGGETERGKHHR